MAYSHALVVEDQDLMRLTLMDELRSVLVDGVVRGARTLDEALDLSQEHKFDLVLIDPGLPGVRGNSKSARLTVVGEIIDSAPEALHIVITGSDDRGEAQACEKLGASAYASKVGLDRDRLRDLISQMATSSFVAFYSEIRSLGSPEFRYAGLTSREQEIVDLMTQEEMGTKRADVYRSIGERLRISSDSAESYFKRARAKLLRRGVYPGADK